MIPHIPMALRTVHVLLWRLLQGSVLYPGAVLAALLALAMFVSQTGWQGLAQNAIAAMEEVIQNNRAAPAGTWMLARCDVAPQAEGVLPAPVTCAKTGLKPVPRAVVVDNLRQQFVLYYGMSLLVSLLVLLFQALQSPRAFIGLPPASERGAGPDRPVCPVTEV